ncbi:MAG: F0F1 ATP synthase subunit epsilon [Holosporaceae bacterium]|nr:F0F1 ATP synthase subunit epsilon [Holosporaceae bacterium]
MKAKILTPEEKLFDGEVGRVILPAVEGEMCLLPKHISLITILKKGLIRIFKPGSEHPIIIKSDGGICSFFSDNAVIILGDFDFDN